MPLAFLPIVADQLDNAAVVLSKTDGAAAMAQALSSALKRRASLASSLVGTAAVVDVLTGAARKFADVVEIAAAAPGRGDDNPLQDLAPAPWVQRMSFKGAVLQLANA